MASLIERHRNQIAGVLSCYDRVVIRGTLPSVCYANAMATTLDARDIRLFDYAKLFAEPLRDAIKAYATKLAADEGIEVEYIKKPTNYRKEDRIRQILAERGTHPGLVHIFSVMELCSSYRPWHDKRTGLTHLRPDHGKCVYYYFYFIDEVLGLCFLSVPTWCPFRAQFYFNGHNWLASRLKAARVSFELQDNAIVAISNWRKAQDLSDSLVVTELHERMDAAVARYVPDLAPLGRYHWSIAQAEYSTDIVFRSAADLAPLYDHLLRTTSPPFLGVHRLQPTSGTLAATSRSASTARAFVITSGRPQSRCTTNTVSFFVWRPPPTTSPSFDTTVWWNSVMVSGS